MLVHILPYIIQCVLQPCFIYTEHFFEKASEKDGMTCLVGQLRGQEDTHLLIGHRCNIWCQRVCDACLPSKEGR